MKETFVAWLCLAAIVVSNSGCPQNGHVPERLDNAEKSAQHDLDLKKCVDDAIASTQVGEPFDKIQNEYNACADAADKKAGLSP